MTDFCIWRGQTEPGVAQSQELEGTKRKASEEVTGEQGKKRKTYDLSDEAN
jgi:hypothetical protein